MGPYYVSPAADRAAAAIRLQQLRRWQVDDLYRLAGVDDPTDVIDALVQQGDVVSIAASVTDVRYVHAESLDELAGRIVRRLRRMHKAEPLRRMLDVKKVMSPWMNQPEGAAFFDAAVARLEQRQQVQRRARNIALTGHGPQLSPGEQQLYTQLVETIEAAGIEPPDVKQLRQQAANNKTSVPQLLQLATADGELVKVNDALYFHANTIEKMVRSLTSALAAGGMTVSEIRQQLGTSRKFALPLCNYLDSIGLTRRDGDKRFLNEGR